MNHHQSLRLTPSNSPFFKSSTPRSPTKAKSEEPGLRLKKVIGTTTASANAFDCLPSARQFAYTAGAAAVVATVGEDLKVTQRFFRARPTLASGSREANGSLPLTPTPSDPRARLLGNAREHGANGSPLGMSGRDWSDSPNWKSATAKDRVKAATSVALSPNGQWIAVGETGYKPRVLIFSNTGESSETPVSVLSEHTFGVHALAFSPDSRYLASLGTVNDGFIYVWTIDGRTGAITLHSSNKCTVSINAMLWVGKSVLTIGLRFVKFWRPDDEVVEDGRKPDMSMSISTPRQKASDFGNSILSPKHRVLPGKNSLLGDLIDANFLAALSISETQAIICTESGDICLLDDCQKAQTLTPVATADFRISAARIDDRGDLHVMGASTRSKKFEIATLHQPRPPSAKKDRRKTISPMKSAPDTTTVIAMATIGDIVVELDSKRGIRLTRSAESDTADIGAVSHQLPAHNDTVLGVQCLQCDSLPEAAFLTFAGNGAVQVWDVEGTSVATLEVPVETSPEMYDLTNELRAVSYLPTASLLAAGDRYGTLSLLDMRRGLVVAQVRAHSTEVVDMVTFERAGDQYIATASRDRTIQLFAWHDDRLDLLQTMDEHAAAVTDLLVAAGGDMFLSCSADRSIVVREAINRNEDPLSVAYLMLRTITLKATPTSMCLMGDHGDMLVSTADRCISMYNFRSGQAGFSFKCSDPEGGEAATLSRCLYAPSLNGNPTIVGVSSGDKSVRLYSEYGSLIARDWGHTEGVTDVALLQSKSGEHDISDFRAQLITVAADSTIFIWDTVAPAPILNGANLAMNGVAETVAPSKTITPMAPPLRKVLSFTEVSRYRRETSIDEEGEPLSPPSTSTFTQPASPQRLRKKTSRSRMSVAQAPRLEPAFRTGFAEHSRRKSLRNRSPSPPSPRGSKKDGNARPSLGMSIRSKSSENALNSYAPSSSISANTSSGFGSLTSSTESVCRTLRAYRKKLATSPASDNIAPDVLRELEKELKLTARVIGEKSQGRNIDEAMMAKLLDQASEKIVSRLDGRIKERVESEIRKTSEGSSSVSAVNETPVGAEDHHGQMDAMAGALENVSLGS